jgi:hypothetical protein
MIRIFSRQIAGIRTEKGQALPFVAMVGLLIFLFFAMTMNLAELLNTKVKAQNAADASALSAAVWEARGLNLVAATNMNLLALWAYLVVNLYVNALLFGACGLVCLSGNPVLLPVCVLCLVFALLSVVGVLGWVATADQTCVAQTEILQAFGLTDPRAGDPQGTGFLLDLLEAEGKQILDLNYSFKPNTQAEQRELYLYTTPAQDLFAKPTWCELIVGVLYYMSWQLVMVSDPDAMRELWLGSAGAVPGECREEGLCNLVAQLYASGQCAAEYDILKVLADRLPGYDLYRLVPLALNREVVDPDPPDPGNPGLVPLEDVLAVSVGTRREQRAPVLLGECPAVAGNRFACPSQAQYSFASARAFSYSTSYFYNVAIAGVTGLSEPIRLIPFAMDWQARLVPMDERGYNRTVSQIQDEPARAFLLNSVLSSNGQVFFLY